MKKRYLVAVIGAVFLAAIGWWGSRPFLFVQAETQMVANYPAEPGEELSISFIHSVQKTPVDEFLTVGENKSELILNSTRYHSFGVGLPFMESDGNFYQDGNDFVMDDMDRHFDSLSLRTGLGTKLTLHINGDEYRLYERFPLGHRIDIFFAPRIYAVKAFINGFYN